jgi:hypothetical protein
VIGIVWATSREYMLLSLIITINDVASECSWFLFCDCVVGSPTSSEWVPEVIGVRIGVGNGSQCLPFLQFTCFKGGGIGFHYF